MNVVILDFRRRSTPNATRIKGSQKRRLREVLLLAQGNSCFLCDEPMDLAGEDEDRSVSIEHVIPRCAGGSNQLGNVVLAHRLCNERADSLMPAPRVIREAQAIGALATLYADWRNNSSQVARAFTDLVST